MHEKRNIIAWNIWNNIILYKLLAFDRNTWYCIIVCKQVIIDK